MDWSARNVWNVHYLTLLTGLAVQFTLSRLSATPSFRG